MGNPNGSKFENNESMKIEPRNIGFFNMGLTDLIKHERGILNVYETETLNHMSRINEIKSIFEINLSKEEYEGIFDKQPSFYE
eukprot:CAMPEP_0168352406 /NCGR_PEP_ID=MMETSP0213-20121227/22553_1 /TAXON_ID=151035 /ORGANISM="Euplotes harpa, Strain FSP1.4" /LENGTH=82 /DNA_ID=CAMNT_0008363653 /DNA_START=20 /DNA_END=267 /DNA_ORIENTATION=-